MGWAPRCELIWVDPEYISWQHLKKCCYKFIQMDKYLTCKTNKISCVILHDTSYSRSWSRPWRLARSNINALIKPPSQHSFYDLYPFSWFLDDYVQRSQMDVPSSPIAWPSWATLTFDFSWSNFAHKQVEVMLHDPFLKHWYFKMIRHPYPPITIYQIFTL